MGMDLAGRDQPVTPCVAQTARTSSSDANSPRAACGREMANKDILCMTAISDCCFEFIYLKAQRSAAVVQERNEKK